MSKRQIYDDEFRANAVVLLEAAGYPDKKGALTATAKQLGIHARTLSRWAKGENNPPPDKVVTEKKADLAELLQEEIYSIFTQMQAVRDKASYFDLGRVMGILMDKHRLTLGEPTSHTKISGDLDVVVDNARSKLAYILDQHAARSGQERMDQLVN